MITKITGFDITQFDVAHQFHSTQLADEEVTLPGIVKEQGENGNLKSLNESLTPTNRRLLKEPKNASRQHSYKNKYK